MQRTIAAAIHLVVFIARTGGRRCVEQVIRVDGFDGNAYRMTLEE
jgi:Flp pilus assembly CpaF family ATPase